MFYHFPVLWERMDFVIFLKMAQEISNTLVSHLKLRGFRHEKTKKKRGSYRGGQIDLQSHSVKFNYSDEE